MKLQLCLIASLAASIALRSQELESLPALHDFESHRITSADPTGHNDDFRFLDPGQTLVLADIHGPGCLVHFRDNITSREPHHLQFHVLRMYWDGEKTPSVEAPIGDFFAVGFGFSEKITTALVCIDQRPGRLTDSAANGAARNCYIPMPYARSARITITNEGRQRSQHWFEVNYRSYRRPPKRQAYFHAQYRQGTPPPAGPYLMLEATGRGHLLGCVLSVKNNDGGWWGEGDEIVFIDGKEAMHGTGSEDYFCESYGLRAGCFPYFGVTLLEEPYVTAYRWHVPDPVVFRKAIRFLIEQGNGNPPFRSGNFYYSVAYWYQTEPHAAFPKLPTPAERISWATNRVTGAIEGKKLRIVSRIGGLTGVQADARWSGGKQPKLEPQR
ncbi:MAG: glycoside hydrolase family 172 protein [Limisphaerales bacterium]